MSMFDASEYEVSRTARAARVSAVECEAVFSLWVERVAEVNAAIAGLVDAGGVADG